MAVEKYVSKIKPDEAVTVKPVKKDTVIESKEYGPILVVKGNFILKFDDGREVGITEADLKQFYKPKK